MSFLLLCHFLVMLFNYPYDQKIRVKKNLSFVIDIRHYKYVFDNISIYSRNTIHQHAATLFNVQ